MCFSLLLALCFPLLFRCPALLGFFLSLPRFLLLPSATDGGTLGKELVLRLQKKCQGKTYQKMSHLYAHTPSFWWALNALHETAVHKKVVLGCRVTANFENANDDSARKLG